MDTIESAFDCVKGQPRVVSTLIKGAKAWANGGDMFCPLITGDAGLGKTHIKLAYQNAMQIAAKISGKDLTTLFYSSPDEIRELDEEFGKLRTHLEDTRALFVTFDEAQDFRDRSTIQTNKVWKFIKKRLDGTGWNDEGKKTIHFDADTNVTVAKNEIGFVCGTNFPERLPDGDAMRGRFNDHLALDALTAESQKEILALMLDNNNFTMEQSAFDVLADCGRGTARIYEKIVDSLKLDRDANKKKFGIITRPKVVELIKSKHLFPLGLKKSEVIVLDKCQAVAGYKQNALVNLTGKEIAEIRKSVYFLQSKDFLNVRTSAITTTKRGKQYLRDLSSAGFVWA